MPRLIVTASAVAGMERCQDFLKSKNEIAASKASDAIRKNLRLVSAHPQIGRPFPLDADLRELVIPFGESGYVGLYRYVEAEDAVYLLAFRHQREAGY